MSHTPGPWVVKKIRGVPVVLHEAPGENVYVCETDGSAPSDANALLIAAAPDLIAALKSLKHVVKELILPAGKGDVFVAEAIVVQGAFSMADAAIAKAEGR